MTPDDVLALIDPNEVVELALALGNIDSPTGSEGEAGRFVRDWLAANGFEPKTYALTEDRINVAAWIHGTGGGHSLIFNAHLDTTLRPDAVLSARDPLDPLYHSAWIDGDEIYGDGVVNDKGPMAAFLVAGKAIRDAGYPLKGDLIVSAVAGEISREPIDEWQGPAYLSKDLGARFMITHGAVADFAIVAEGTGFGIVGIEPGKAHFKVTVVTDTPRYYTPYLPRPTGLADAPNAIVRTGAVIAAFETWAYDYQQRQTYRGEHGTIVPKASINAIRSGYPYNLTSAPQVCQLFVDTRILPGANPLDLREELRGVLAGVGVEGTVELFLYRPGFEALGADRLIETVRRAHDQVFDTPPEIVGEPVTSMWRDTNAFNELGIPAISYAPRSRAHAAKKSFKVKDLTDAAVVYARIAMDLCNQERAPFTPLGAHPNRAIAASVNGD
ncbi:MAG TPA: M20/M25/M40 family metallo-hydrolase [Candidatus Limnocylindrales bacterium]|jgi:acetylornithine deacetylase/succinyl-diaminopimelate desuccinylase-like protein|nr:M20/M25/M40 family metallo-hydrolase [Candidatus Limnocylindrales bacterium]